MKHLLILFAILYSLNSNAQDNINLSGMNWGINMGMYFSSSKDALFYNAQSGRPFALEDIVYSQTVREKLYELLDDNFTINQVPSIMRYKPAVTVGLNLQYYTSKKIAYFLNLNILKQDAYGLFKLELASPTTDPAKTTNTQDGYITASEKRFNAEAGMHILLDEVKPNMFPYIDLGFNASVLQTDEHYMEILSYKTSIAYSEINGNHLYSAFGYGAIVGAGLQFPLSSKYYVFTGVTGEMLQYNLLDNGFTFHKSIIARVMF